MAKKKTRSEYLSDAINGNWELLVDTAIKEARGGSHVHLRMLLEYEKYAIESAPKPQRQGLGWAGTLIEKFNAQQHQKAQFAENAAATAEGREPRILPAPDPFDPATGPRSATWSPSAALPPPGGSAAERAEWWEKRPTIEGNPEAASSSTIERIEGRAESTPLTASTPPGVLRHHPTPSDAPGGILAPRESTISGPIGRSIFAELEQWSRERGSTG